MVYSVAHLPTSIWKLQNPFHPELQQAWHWLEESIHFTFPATSLCERGASDSSGSVVTITMLKTGSLRIKAEIETHVGGVFWASNAQQHVRPRLCVFVSGKGSNLRAIHMATTTQKIRATIEVVVTDNTSCGACAFAKDVGIAVVEYSCRMREGNGQTASAGLKQALVQDYAVDYVLLAGYRKLVPADVVAAYPRAMLNIHPSLLPAFGGKGFYGSKVHKAVVNSGARFTGPTVHFVDSEYDTGPILAQRVIPVHPLEDHKQLAARVLKEEQVLYPDAVAALVEQRISWREDGVPVLWKAI